jgi:hypothetical protein
MRGQEVAAVGEAVRSNRAEFGEAKAGPVVFAEVAAGLGIEQFHAKLDAAGNEGDFAGCETEDAKLGVEQ